MDRHVLSHFPRHGDAGGTTANRAQSEHLRQQQIVQSSSSRHRLLNRLGDLREMGNPLKYNAGLKNIAKQIFESDICRAQPDLLSQNTKHEFWLMLQAFDTLRQKEGMRGVLASQSTLKKIRAMAQPRAGMDAAEARLLTDLLTRPLDDGLTLENWLTQRLASELYSLFRHHPDALSSQHFATTLPQIAFKEASYTSIGRTLIEKAAENLLAPVEIRHKKQPVNPAPPQHPDQTLDKSEKAPDAPPPRNPLRNLPPKLRISGGSTSSVNSSATDTSASTILSAVWSESAESQRSNYSTATDYSDEVNQAYRTTLPFEMSELADTMAQSPRSKSLATDPLQHFTMQSAINSWNEGTLSADALFAHLLNAPTELRPAKSPAAGNMQATMA